MREHTLSSDTTVAIFTEEAADSLFDDFKKKPNFQRQFLSRLHNALTSATPQTYVEKPYRGVDNIQQFRAGDVMRGYCVFADEPEAYDVFYFFQVTDHKYDAYPVSRYDSEAGTVLDELRGLADETETEEYLNDHNALDADDIEELLDRI